MKNKSLRIHLYLFMAILLSASNFLRMVPDSRSLSLGCANNGISSGVSSLCLNPAGLVDTEHFETDVSHLTCPFGPLDFYGRFALQYEYLALAVRHGAAAVGANFGFYHQPEFTFDDRSYQIHSGYFSLSGASALSGIDAGVRIKTSWETFGSDTYNAWALDLGLRRSFDLLRLTKGTAPNMTVGISCYNLGTSLPPKNSTESLPASAQAGYGYYFFRNLHNALLLVNDLKYFFSRSDFYGSFEVSTGVEYTFERTFSAACGWLVFAPLDAPAFLASPDNKFSAGVGFSRRFAGTELKAGYSLVLSFRNRIRSTHAISLGFRHPGYIEKALP